MIKSSILYTILFFILSNLYNLLQKYMKYKIILCEDNEIIRLIQLNIVLVYGVYIKDNYLHICSHNTIYKLPYENKSIIPLYNMFLPFFNSEIKFYIHYCYILIWQNLSWPIIMSIILYIYNLPYIRR